MITVKGCRNSIYCGVQKLTDYIGIDVRTCWRVDVNERHESPTSAKLIPIEGH